MRLLRVDSKANKVSEIKTFDPIKSKFVGIQTAIENDNAGGKYLLEESPGEYYEFDVKDGKPHFLPGNEGLHEGVPEKHLARIQRNPDTLRETKEKYGDFYLDTPGGAPEENPFVTPTAPPESEAEAEGGEETREELDPNAPTEVEAEETAEEAPETDVATEEAPVEETDAAEGEVTEDAPEATDEVTDGEVIEDVEDAAVAEAEAEQAEGETTGETANTDFAEIPDSGEGEATE